MKNTLRIILCIMLVHFFIPRLVFAEGKPEAGKFSLEIKNKLITLQAQDANFKDILRSLEQKTGIKVVIYEDVADKKVSLNIQSLPFYAINKLFEKMSLTNSAVVYDPQSGNLTVYILSKDKDVSKVLKGRSVIKQADFVNGSTINHIKGREIITITKGKNKVPIRYTQDEVLLKFHRGVLPDEIEEILKRHRLIKSNTNDTLSKIGYIKVRVLDGRDVIKVIKELRKEYKLSVQEPNYILSTLTIQDPLYKDQWYIPDTNFDKAWDKLQRKNAVRVAVLDTGVDSKHPDLMGTIIKGYDFVNSDPNVLDDHGHGTFIAGIIAAKSNTIGIRGLYDYVQIMPVKVINENGLGTCENVAQGILWAADNQAKVINLSMGGYGYSFILGDAVDYALEKGCIIVAPAGNDGIEQAIYPAAYPDVISVSALDSSGQIWGNSNRGKYIDISAPGVNILSTGLGNNYFYASGTSAAASMAAALGAVIVSERPELSNSAVRSLMMQSAKDRGEKGWDAIYGAGEIDAHAALLQEIKPFHDVAVRRVKIEPLTFDKDRPTYIIATIANVGTYSTEKCDALLYKVMGETKEQISKKEGITVIDTTSIIFEWVTDRPKEVFSFEVHIFSNTDINSANNFKTSTLFTLNDTNNLFILYEVQPPVHQWIAYQAYKKLLPSALREEMADYIGPENDDSSYLDGNWIAPNNWHKDHSYPYEAKTAIIEGAWEEDKDDSICGIGLRPRYHFWDPRGGFGDGILIIFDSAIEVALDTFKKALSYYPHNKSYAYYWLGRTAHLLMDMSVPAHVLNDQHWLDFHDNYEWYTSYVSKSKGPIYKLIKFNDPDTDILTPLLSYDDTPSYADADLVKLFYNLATYSQKYDSDDEEGTEDKGKYNSFTCKVKLTHSLDRIVNVLWYRQTEAGDLTTGAMEPLSIKNDYEYDIGIDTIQEWDKPAIYLCANIPSAFDEKAIFEDTYDVLFAEYYDEENQYQKDTFETLDDKQIYPKHYSIVPTSVFERRDTFNSAIGYVAALYQLFWERRPLPDTNIAFRILGETSVYSQKPHSVNHDNEWNNDDEELTTENYNYVTHVLYPYPAYDLEFGNHETGKPGMNPYQQTSSKENLIPLILIHGIQSDNGLTDPTQLVEYAYRHSAENYWKKFIEYFENTPKLNQKYKLYLYKYPSYKHITYNARILNNLIEEINYLKARKVMIIGHSMGGLIVRSLIEEHGFQNALALITLGTPHHGSPSVMKNWVDLGSVAEWICTDLNTPGAQDLFWDNYDGIMEWAKFDLIHTNPYDDQLPGDGRMDYLAEFDEVYRQRCINELLVTVDFINQVYSPVPFQIRRYPNPWLTWLNERLKDPSIPYFFYGGYNETNKKSENDYLLIDSVNLLDPTKFKVATGAIYDIGYVNDVVVPVTSAFLDFTKHDGFILQGERNEKLFEEVYPGSEPKSALYVSELILPPTKFIYHCDNVSTNCSIRFFKDYNHRRMKDDAEASEFKNENIRIWYQNASPLNQDGLKVTYPLFDTIQYDLNHIFNSTQPKIIIRKPLFNETIQGKIKIEADISNLCEKDLLNSNVRVSFHITDDKKSWQFIGYDDSSSKSRSIEVETTDYKLTNQASSIKVALWFGNYTNEDRILVSVDNPHSPKPPKLLSPPSTQNEALNPDDIKFEWYPSPDAEFNEIKYCIIINDADKNEFCNTCKDPADWTKDLSIDDIPKEFAENSKYCWTVHASNHHGILSDKDEEWCFTTGNKNNSVTSPVAIFTVNTNPVYTNTPFLVDASLSYDKEDGKNLQYSWQWEPNGSYSAWTTTKSTTHQYTSKGTYTITLGVKDSKGLKDYSCKQITVLEKVVIDQLPWVTITQKPENPTTDTRPEFKYQGYPDADSIAGYYCVFDSKHLIEGDIPSPSLYTNQTSYCPAQPLVAAQSHVFYVRAKDKKGHLSPLVSYSFTIEAPTYAAKKFKVIPETISLRPGEKYNFTHCCPV